MRKWEIVLSLSAIVVVSVVIYSCSKENATIQQERTLKGAKIAALSTAGDNLTYPAEICAGKEIELCVTFPQGTTGGKDPKPKETNWQAQLKGDDPATEAVEDFYQIAHGGGNTIGCFKYTFPSAGIYDLRYKASESNFKDVSLTVTNCCEESFTYAENEDGTYTFSYTSEVDVEDAALVFTFAQSAYQSGLPEAQNWVAKGQTMQTIMDLKACEKYTWIVTLKANCSGHSGASNVWTDFKVNDYSKKNNPEDKFIQVCPEE